MRPRIAFPILAALYIAAMYLDRLYCLSLIH